MRERMSLVGGRLAISSRPGAGTTVRAEVPLGGLTAAPAMGRRP